MALDGDGRFDPTLCCTLAIAHEAGADFTLKDIDRISRQVPCLAKVAPNSTKYHIEHVHRAGGIPALLGELNRAGLLHKNVHSVVAVLDSSNDVAASIQGQLTQLIIWWC